MKARVIAIQPAAGDDSAELVSLYARQPEICPRAVSGVFARWRWTMVWLTQAVFYGGPWLSWDGRQAILFDIAQRRFHLFGLVLQPQDLIFLAALLVISALALFFFTAVAGRLWCGYACPQTVYTEIFLWLERRIEGDRIARMRLDAAPWGAAKLDVCDDVMGRMGYPKGLIRYATENGVRQGWTRQQMLARVGRPRVWIYGALLVAVSVGLVAALALRAGHTVDVHRDRGTLARVDGDGWVENGYRVQVGNRLATPQRYRLSARGLDGSVVAGPAEVEVMPYDSAPVALRLRLPPAAAEALSPGAHAVEWVVERIDADGDARTGGQAVRSGSTFFVPR